MAPSPSTLAFVPDRDQEAVLSHERGPLLVTGGPGTGKTAVLRERLARLIEEGVDPERVVMVVRHRAAREDARTAVLGRLRSSLPSVKVLTVHGLAHHVLSWNYSVLGYSHPPEVLTAADHFSKVRELLHGEDLTDWPAYGQMLHLRGFADEVRQLLLRAQEALVGPDEMEARSAAMELGGWRELAAFYRRYLDVVYSEEVVDFAGLVNQAAAAAEGGEPLFDHLLVDDYQDGTFATEKLLVGVRAGTLVVAGDPGSHVFSFQGTTDAPIRRFTAQLPNALHRTLRTQHRRSELQMAAWSAPHASEEYSAIARELRRTHVQEGVAWSRMAVVLRRQGTELAALLRTLDDVGIPRSVPEGGLSLLVEPGTFPFVLALRWLARPAERDGLVESMLTSELAQLSPATARGLVRVARAKELPAAAALQERQGLSDEERAALDVLGAALDEAEPLARRSVLDTFRVLWRRLPCSLRLVTEGEGPREGGRALDAVLALSSAITHAGERGETTVAAFLDLLEAGEEGPRVRDPAPEGDEGAVRVYTAHGTAGKEFDTVIAAGAVEGNFPSLSRPEPMFDLTTLERRVSQSERNRLRLQDERRLFRLVTGRAQRRVLFTASEGQGEGAPTAPRSRFVTEAGVAWSPAPRGPFEDPLTPGEAAASWRRRLADRTTPSWDRLAALHGILGLGVDCASWWFRRDWTGTDRPLHESIRVSHSKLESLVNCRLQFVLGQELGLEGAVGYQAWVGSLVHRIIEDCENGLVPRSEEALVAAAESRWKRQQFPSMAVSEAFRRLVTKAMLPAWFREYGATPAAANEVRFEFDFDGAGVTGVIDRVSRIQGGGSVITDYKTGKSRNAGKAEENLQLGIYYLAVNHAEELEPFRPVKGIELVFLRDVDWHSGQIARAQKAFLPKEQQEYHEGIRVKLGDLIGELRELQRTENYHPNPAANCRFCDFRTLCPLWPEGRELFPVEANGR